MLQLQTVLKHNKTKKRHRIAHRGIPVRNVCTRQCILCWRHTVVLLRMAGRPPACHSCTSLPIRLAPHSQYVVPFDSTRNSVFLMFGRQVAYPLRYIIFCIPHVGRTIDAKKFSQQIGEKPHQDSDAPNPKGGESMPCIVDHVLPAVTSVVPLRPPNEPRELPVHLAH